MLTNKNHHKSIPLIWPLLITGLISTPLYLWSQSVSTLPLFTNFSSTTRTLGQITALIGVVLFCLNYILAARFKFIENIRGGLGKVYLSHHAFGAIGFSLLLLHPMFLTLQYLPLSLEMSSQFLLSTEDTAILFGKIALIVMMILLFITFYMKLAYNTWKKTHQLLGISLFFALLHITFIEGNLSTTPNLRLYLFVLFSLAIVSYIRSTLWKQLFMKRHRYLVTTIVQKNDDIIEIFMRPKDKPFVFSPGQFVFIKILKAKGITKEDHPFSITSSPESEELSIAVKSLGDFTETMKLLKPETEIMIEGPYGHFLHTHKDKQVWIAGGIGITPFLSMARALKNTTPQDIALYYLVKNPTDAAYKQELENISLNNPNFKVITHASTQLGRITAKEILNTIPDLKKRQIFICGPLPLINSLKKQFKQLKIKKKHIHSEEFSLY